jgi:hypothetical protein
MPRTIQEQKVTTFCEAYETALTNAVLDHPEEYCYPLSAVPGVIDKMRRAFIAGTYNHNSRAIRAACKALSIKHTRTAMETYFQGNA